MELGGTPDHSNPGFSLNDAAVALFLETGYIMAP